MHAIQWYMNKSIRAGGWCQTKNCAKAQFVNAGIMLTLIN